MNNSSRALDLPKKKTEHIGLAAPANETDADAAIDLEAVWYTIKRGKWIILGMILLCTGLAAGYTATLPEIFEAKSMVAVEADPTARTPQVMAFSAPPDLEGEIGLLRNSGDLYQRVVTRVRAIADTTESVRFTVFEPDETGAAVTDYAAGTRLQEMMEFRGYADAGMVEISASSESPEEATVLANVFADAYREFSQAMARAGVVAARGFLEEQLQKRKEDIRMIETEWETFAQSRQVATDGEDGQRVAQEYVELQTQRDGLQFQLEQEQRTLAVLKDQFDTARPSLRQSVLSEQQMQGLRTQIQVIETKLADLKAQAEPYYINNPSLRGNESRVPELADLKRQIDGFESRRVELTEELVIATNENEEATAGEGGALGQVGTLRQRIQEQELAIGQLNAQIAALDNRIAGYQGRLQTIPRQTIQREQIDRRLAQAEQFYKDIAMELQRTIIAEESELGYVSLVRAAVIPRVPVSPDAQTNLILGLLLGIALGLGFAFVRQAMNWQIYDPKDIQHHGYSLIGVIPEMTKEIKKAFKGAKTVDVDGRQMSTSLLPLLNPWSPITENYRLVRTNLQFSNRKNGEEDVPQVLMITSPEPGDGKTTTAVNLAITIALSGRRVLLIDADMRRPNCHKLLGVDRNPGLAQMLTLGTSVEVVQRSFIDGLYFVPAGTPDVPPTEMLDSERMRKLVALGRQRCDVVIIDTPPVLAASDPVVLAAQADATLVVASANKTDLRALEQTKKTLGAVGVPISGVIFNRYNAAKSGSDYRYGYGYDYKYDYSPTA